MAEPFLGQILMFAGNFDIRGWAFCNGQLLSIAQNSALFSLLGTTYGGDGQTTFALPDLRGRAPLHFSPTHPEGEVAGAENVTLLQTQLPQHSHAVSVGASNASATASRPVGNVCAGATKYDVAANAGGSLGAVTVANTGGDQPHNNMQPYLAINYIIALEGIYPSRN